MEGTAEGNKEEESGLLRRTTLPPPPFGSVKVLEPLQSLIEIHFQSVKETVKWV
jgi:hypothetical protein